MELGVAMGPGFRKPLLQASIRLIKCCVRMRELVCKARAEAFTSTKQDIGRYAGVVHGATGQLASRPDTQHSDTMYVRRYGKEKGCIQMKEKGCIQMSLTITTTTATATLAQKEYFCSVRALLPGLAAADVQWLLPMGHAQCQQSYWCCDCPAVPWFIVVSTTVVTI